MNAGIVTVGLFALVVGVWTYVHKDAPRTTVLLWLLGGLVISGVVGALLGQLLATGMTVLGTTTGRLLGVGGAAVIAAIGLVMTLEVVIKGMGIKIGKRGGGGGFGGKGGGTTKRWHAPLALALPTVVVAAGVPVVTGLISAMSQAAGSLPIAQLGG